MPIITALKPQKNGKRVNVYLDGKFGFAIDLDNLVILGLKKNKKLTEEKVKEIVKKAQYQKTLNKLLRYVTLRPRSEREINIWFRKKKIHNSLHGPLKEKLKKLELLNDQKFAEWWIEQRNLFRPRGKRALQSELFLKGVKRETINSVLADVEIDELKIAKNLLKKYAYKWERYDTEKAKQKKIRFLAGKGIQWQVIKKTLAN